MNTELTSPLELFNSYTERLNAILKKTDMSHVAKLAHELMGCVENGRSVYICGNGGSAGNAVHIANDFLYGITKVFGKGMRVHALSANTAVMTCLANDEGYENMYSYQLGVQAQKGDVLIVLSGSGNSPNILNALETAREIGVKSYGILGYSGGKAKSMCDVPLHFEINDMQISEDLQLIVAHMIMQWLYQNRDRVINNG